MKSIIRQRGIGVLNLAFIAVVLAFAGLVGLKLLPVYSESLKIDKAMKGTIEQSDIGSRTKREIVVALAKRLDIDDVRRIHDQNFKEYGTITKKGEKVTIELSYDAIVPLMGNLSILAEFEKEVTN
jgi:hypothetical protein